MAKEKFVRSKPHVNVGTIGQTVLDTSGNLQVDDSGSDTEGNLAPSSVLTFSAPASSSSETATVAFPIDTDFVFDPNSSGPAVSIDFQFDVLTSISGTPEIDVTLAIVQGGKSFIASHVGGSPSVDNSTAAWATVGQTGLLPEEFSEVGGGPDRVDFGQPFQFGYAFTSHYSTTALSVELGLDNMQVEITTIPEPTTIALAFAMGAALLWHRWWDDALCANTDEDKQS